MARKKTLVDSTPVERFLTVREVAMSLGLSPRTIQSYIRDKKLKAWRLGSRTLLVERQSFENWKTQNLVELS